MKNKEQLREGLFKKILGDMIAVEYCELSEAEVIKTAMGAITAFRKLYFRPYDFKNDGPVISTIIQPRKCYICQTEYETDKEARACEDKGQQEILPIGLLVHIKDRDDKKKIVAVGTPLTMGHENMYFFMNEKGEQEPPQKLTIEDVGADIVYANEFNINRICYILRKLGIKPKMINSDGVIVTL